MRGWTHVNGTHPHPLPSTGQTSKIITRHEAAVTGLLSMTLRNPALDRPWDLVPIAAAPVPVTMHEKEVPVNRSQTKRHLPGLICVVAAMGFACSSPLRAEDSPPSVVDGLQLRTNTGSSLVYVKPGATFGKYDKVAILDCFVEFDKNWQSNYNSSQVDPSTFVSSDDMNRIKQELAAAFKKIFTQELQAGGYQVVTYGAPDVLVLRPAIINLRVTAPDLMTPGINATVVSSAGSATLYLELWDSVTNTLLARAMNSQADQQFGGQVASSVTNTQAADFILKSWADNLRKHLEAARASKGG